MNENITQRLSVKTPEQQFLNKLEQEFEFAPRVAGAILQEAKECLLGQEEPMSPGQKRVFLTKRGARHGRPLREVEKVEVFWTIDAGPEDMEIGKKEGAIGLRRARIERLLEEALVQGAAATQEDLAWALNVDTRTVRRDCAWLRAEGKEVATRGNLQGIGRGQTHKRQILARWLAGETYDQITLQCHHNAASVARYIQGLVRVVHLTKEGFSPDEVALLLPMSCSLVAEYLAVYEENDTALARRRLTDHRRRITKGVSAVKRGPG